MNITEFQHPDGSGFVGWVSSGKVVRKTFLHDVLALKLRSSERVIVVELTAKQNNATIYSEDGEELCTIENPDSQALCFGDVYYAGDELTLVSRRRDASMTACVIDEDGKILRTHETR